jgi:hypothetical protein
MAGYGTHPTENGQEGQADKPSSRPPVRAAGRKIREGGLVLFFIGIASGAVALTILVTPTTVSVPFQFCIMIHVTLAFFVGYMHLA